MESQPQNPAFRINPENFYPCTSFRDLISVRGSVYFIVTANLRFIKIFTRSNIYRLDSDQARHIRERSGSDVECLTRDRGAAGSTLTGVTVLCP